jgi:outer membrane protein assembly factor BamB
MTNRLFVVVLALAAAAAASGNANARDWPSFRGEGGRSLALNEAIPATWNVDDGTNVAWTAALPGRGVSGPIVVGGKVIVTASSGPNEERLHVLAFDEATGKRLWQRQFWATGRTLFHPTMANATPTPASDGQRVFAFYSSNDLVCLDLDGNLQWIRGLVLEHPKLGNDVGMSSSPVASAGAVIVQCESQGDAFAAAFDATTGAVRWKIDRPKQAQWASPTAIDEGNGGRPAVVLQSSTGVSLHDATTGSPLWERKISCGVIPSAVVESGRLYVPGSALTVFLLNERDRTAEEPLWAAAPLNPSTSSPVIADGCVYVINSAGVLVCGNAETGDIHWRRRLTGQFWATPVAVGDHLICINTEGAAFVVDRADDGKIAAENHFNTEVLGSPAASNNALFVRSHGKLWKIAAKGVAAVPAAKAPR